MIPYYPVYHHLGDALCVDTKPKDTCDVWKQFGFCYKGNKAMEWCCATCSEKLDEPKKVEDGEFWNNQVVWL